MNATTALVLDPEWKVADLSIVGLLQERETRQIIGAGTTRVSTRQE